MDKSAIQQIQETGNTELFIKQLQERAKFPVAALPVSFQLHDLEQYQPHRNSFRGIFSTQHIAQFALYHKLSATAGAQCFINADCMTATTIFDLFIGNDAGHCNNKAKLALKKTSLFRALLDIDGCKLPQKALAEWIEDYASSLEIFSTSGEKIEIPTASAAVRNMKFEAKAGRESSVDDFSQHQSEYESIAVRTKEEYPMPSAFKFTCIPYHGLSERTFEMRMSTIGNETLVLRIRKMEEQEEEMSDEFLHRLTAEFEHNEIDIKSFIGTFS